MRWLAPRSQAGSAAELASKVDDSPRGSSHGRLLLDGTFDAGMFPLYEPTGVERIFSSSGGGLGRAVSDGATQSELALTETRADLPPPCHCIPWLVQVQPSDDPAFADGMWDAEGNGVWVPIHEAEGANARLSHLAEPMVETKVASLPAATDWTIVGADPPTSASHCARRRSGRSRSSTPRRARWSRSRPARSATTRPSSSAGSREQGIGAASDTIGAWHVI